MRVFLDANILVTVLCNEYPRFTACSRILSLCDDPRFEVFTSPICVAIAAYFTEKKNGQKLAKKKIAILLDKLRITIIDEAMTKEAALNKKIDDMEDGLQYYSALHANCKSIVTYDKNDFHFSQLEVVDAEQFLLKYAVRNTQKS
ncbi:MAG: PIN domain-containing protein [Flavobacteriales bacterium]|nr:PIN domain-containing protein [Flavobacteriales bacterium]